MLQIRSLKHINLDCGTFGRSVNYLSRYPNAESVFLTSVLSYHDVYPKPFSLDGLTFLGIPFNFCTTLQHIFKAPNLEELVMFTPNDFTHQLDRRGIQTLPFHSLKRVTLMAMSLLHSSRELYEFMASHPGIDQLTLRYICDPATIALFLAYGDKKDKAYWPFLQRLGLPENHGPLLPSLTMLRFEESLFTTCGLLGACLMDLLEARPALSFACGLAEWKAWPGEAEARFGHRLVHSPVEKPRLDRLDRFWG
jgi:hypothetical protein